jgi:hypothetical protein
MQARTVSFVSLGLLSCACAFTGYDFDDYKPAMSGAASSSAKQPATAGKAGAPSDGGSQPEAGGASQSAGGVGGEAACRPLDCLQLQAECGIIAGDGCGNPLDCGGCFWWFEECSQNVCIIVE